MPINYNQHRVNIGTNVKNYSKYKTKTSKWSKISKNSFHKSYKGIKSVSYFLIMYILIAISLNVSSYICNDSSNHYLYFKDNIETNSINYIHKTNTQVYFCFSTASYIYNYSSNRCLYG